MDWQFHGHVGDVDAVTHLINSLFLSGSVVLGIILTVIGSCFMAFGNTYMKRGLHLQQEKCLGTADRNIPSMAYHEITWWIGIISYTFGALIHVIALGFAPASILAPMNSFGLVANAFAAATLLDEHFGCFELVSTVGVIFGICLCALASVLPSNSLSKKYDGIDSWSDPYYLLYIIFCFICALAVLIVINNEEAKYNEEKDIQTRRAVLKTMDEESFGFSTSNQSSPQQQISSPNTNKIKVSLPEYPQYISMLYGLLAGLIGAQCVLEIKEIVAWGEYAMKNPATWMYHIQPYVAFVVFGISTWLQMHFLNLGLARGDATLVVPAYYVFWTLFSTFGGFSKFHEFQGFTLSMTIIFTIGIIITTVFVIIMSIREILAFKKAVDENVPHDDEVESMPENMESVRSKLDVQLPLSMGVLTMIHAGRLAGRYFANASTNLLRKTRSASDLLLQNKGSIELIFPHKDIWTLPSNVHSSAIVMDGNSSYQSTIWRPKAVNELVFDEGSHYEEIK
ncbi:hypothetical protein ACR3K2_13420 [Cryptosporidium serpentis]